MNNLNNSKKCLSCQLEKDVTEFHKHKQLKDGRYYYCKTCCKIKAELRKLIPKIMVKEKKCNRCGSVKDIQCFHKKINTPDGFSTICKTCRVPQTKAYRDKNIESIKIASKKARDAFTEQQKQNRRDKVRAWRTKRKENSFAMLKANIRSLISQNFKNSTSFRKGMKSVEILGCSFKEFRGHIEKQFLSWMTWENRGLYTGGINEGWDLDHIIPSSSAKTYEDVIRLNHYTNFQPLCSKVNRDEKRQHVPNVCNTYFKDESFKTFKTKIKSWKQVSYERL
jgi:hypothetical protein